MVKLFVIQISNSDGASDKNGGGDQGTGQWVKWQCPHVESALVFHKAVLGLKQDNLYVSILNTITPLYEYKLLAEHLIIFD